jgi:hypothetical protein
MENSLGAKAVPEIYLLAFRGICIQGYGSFLKLAFLPESWVP